MKLSPLEFYKTSTKALYRDGERYTDGVGRTFRFALAGALELGKGKLAVAPTVISTHVSLSWAVAPAIGDTEVTVTLGATNAATKDQYKEGYLVVKSGTGLGRAYSIAGHPAAAASASLKVTLREAIDTAGATGETNVDLIASPYAGSVISVTDQADQVAGVPVVAIPIGYYGWLQTGGPCAVLQDEIIAVGAQVTTGSSVAGAVEMLDAAGEPCVGEMMVTSADATYALVNLLIDRPLE